MKMSTQALIAWVIALAMALAFGCSSSSKHAGDGREMKNIAGTYTATVEAPPDKVTNAAKTAVEQLGMRDVRGNPPTKMDGMVTAKTADNEDVTVNVTQDGANRSKVSIRVGVLGNDRVSHRIYEKIRDNL